MHIKMAVVMETKSRLTVLSGDRSPNLDLYLSASHLLGDIYFLSG